MGDIKTRVQGVDPNVEARDLVALVKDTQNIYTTVNIIEKRAAALNSSMREELHNKLEEFAVVTDRIEEVQENKEQIEISKFYERLPSPAIIAIQEFVADLLHVENLRPQFDKEDIE